MKYLLFILLFSCLGTTLVAQDTLYIKGKKPRLVEIKNIKKKSLNYTKVGSVGLRTISLNKVKKISFGINSNIETQPKVEENTIVKKEEFKSTVSVQLNGVIFSNQIGANYLHRISPAITTQKTSYWVKIGGGYLAERTLRRTTTGTYLEFGARAEIIYKGNVQNRFHIGLDISHQWAEGSETSDVNLFSSGPSRMIEDSRLAFQIPIGYTYRGEKGLYVTSGVEISSYLLFPAINISIGYTFGK